MAKDEKREREPGLSGIIGGELNIFGLKIDLGQLLGAPEKLTGGLEELRETLKRAGGKEVLSDEEWRQGGMTVTGHIRTGGLLGEREFHVGTMGRPGRAAAGRQAPEPPQVVEPPVDVFDEGQQVTIVADVPGVSEDDLELKVEGSVFSLATRATARRSYRKELRLDADLDPDSLESTCHNGVLEVRLWKRGGT